MDEFRIRELIARVLERLRGFFGRFQKKSNYPRYMVQIRASPLRLDKALGDLFNFQAPAPDVIFEKDMKVGIDLFDL